MPTPKGMFQLPFQKLSWHRPIKMALHPKKVHAARSPETRLWRERLVVPTLTTDLSPFSWNKVALDLVRE